MERGLTQIYNKEKEGDNEKNNTGQGLFSLPFGEHAYESRRASRRGGAHSAAQVAQMAALDCICRARSMDFMYADVDAPHRLRREMRKRTHSAEGE